ncbi:MAG: ribosome small subunit-dependent GTPase A [Chloroflexi bacterium AL-W]|nr:ribosome small subunit-dependent GTPase A [Chloroflexi bacterium AL-N1]NOK70473.1 ribosome small subunit-dependent GTPase A [Chloroflexi bacterium AL-N10]NOK78168.1 ribosome small subunit-dependent GTPase A [Chloroflexi bacterium AL-N5]NOK85267.1 ribosome small subunit-dependent GTPase A [Chloroflexi bacterium AL-W]NOK92032.1 ribosome small subunit-dependent GTPase A [Chloroflexi bacterium AL-N15]
MQGMVLRAQSGFFWVQTEHDILECRLRGRLKKERQSTDIAIIGDIVEVTQVSPTTGAIEAVHPRQSKLARRASGSKGAWKEDIIVANVNQVLLVVTCTQPDFSPRMLDRYLILTEDNELDAVIVANKVDLVGEEHARAMFAVYEQIGYRIVYTSTYTSLGIEELQACLAGRISVVTGKSGVGKSSLLNAIQPGLSLATGDISEALNKGRHTTTVAELIPLQFSDGYVADTPGIRSLALWRFPLEDLEWCFREFRPFLDECYFAGCTHIHEPDCAILAAVGRGDIAAIRHDSYVRLYEQTAEDS